MFPSPKSNPADKTYIVLRQKGAIITSPGNVRASNQVLADTKAKRLFGYDVWTKLKEEVHA